MLTIISKVATTLSKSFVFVVFSIFFAACTNLIWSIVSREGHEFNAALVGFLIGLVVAMGLIKLKPTTQTNVKTITSHNLNLRISPFNALISLASSYLGVTLYLTLAMIDSSTYFDWNILFKEQFTFLWISLTVFTCLLFTQPSTFGWSILSGISLGISLFFYFIMLQQSTT